MVNLQFYSRIIRRKLTEAEAVGCPGPRPEVRKRDSGNESPENSEDEENL